MGTLLHFPAIFAKGNNCCDFLYISLDVETFKLEEGGKNKNGMVASPENVHRHLNTRLKIVSGNAP